MISVGRVSEAPPGNRALKGAYGPLFVYSGEFIMAKVILSPSARSARDAERDRVSSQNAKSKIHVGSMTTVSGVEMSRDLAQSIRDVPRNDQDEAAVKNAAGASAGSVWFHPQLVGKSDASAHRTEPTFFYDNSLVEGMRMSNP